MNKFNLFEELEFLESQGCICRSCNTYFKKVFREYTKRFNINYQYSKEIYKDFKEVYGVELV